MFLALLIGFVLLMAMTSNVRALTKGVQALTRYLERKTAEKQRSK